MNQTPDRYRLVIDCEVEVFDPQALQAAGLPVAENPQGELGAVVMPSDGHLRIVASRLLEQWLLPGGGPGVRVVGGVSTFTCTPDDEGRYPAMTLAAKNQAGPSAGGSQ